MGNEEATGEEVGEACEVRKVGSVCESVVSAHAIEFAHPRFSAP
jgi:hypothetical protein